MPSRFGKVYAKKLYLPDGKLKGQANKMTRVTATPTELNIMDGVTATASEINNASDQTKQTEYATATKQIVVGDHGKTFWLNASTEFTTTLPAIADAGLGFTVEFIVMGAPLGANYVITELATADTNKLNTNGIIEGEVDTGTDALYNNAHTFVNFIQSIAVRGDRARFRCDGYYWLVDGYTKADGGITLT